MRRTFRNVLLFAGFPLLAAAGDLGSAKWIAESPAAPFDATVNRLVGVKIDRPVLRKDALRFRKVFRLQGKAVSEATVAVCGLGFYELHLNGTKADASRVLAPAFSDPERILHYDVYDVTRLVRPGDNAVGLWLAPGYSDDYFQHGWRWLKPKQAILRLSVRYGDGTTDEVVTDASWQWTDEQPIRYASIYNGEVYDASREDPDWCRPAGSRATWRPVREVVEKTPLAANAAPPVRLFDRREARRILKSCDGGRVWDFGQNRAGVPEIRVRAPKGTEIEIQCAEEMANEWDLDMWTHRAARQRDIYLCAGTGEWETYRPRFAYHGFRYVKVKGLPEDQLTASNVVSWAVSADLRQTATFSCSDETLNWMFDAARWSMRSNLLSYPTDCCQRDERTPCLMDSQCYEDTAMRMFDMRAFYTKWIADAVHATNLCQDAGNSGSSYNNANPDWGGDPITLAERLYGQYGDLGPVRRNWPALVRRMELILSASPGLVHEEGYGDWCPPDNRDIVRRFDVALVNSALLCEDLRVMARLAPLVGDDGAAGRFATLARRAREAFASRFVDAETGRVDVGRQVSYVLPLAFGLLDSPVREKSFERLLSRIRDADGGHVGVGIYGLRYLGDVLLDNGAGDLWLRMLRGPDWPSFGHMRAKGATTFWEQWTYRGWMHSHNHAMMSGAVSCFFTHLGGIRPEEPGYRAVLVKPVFPAGLDFVDVTQETVVGRFETHWRRQADGSVDLRVVVPARCRGRLELPDGTVRALPAGESRVTVVKVGEEVAGA